MEGININHIVRIKANRLKNELEVEFTNRNSEVYTFETEQQTVDAFNLIANQIGPNFLKIDIKF